MKVFGIGLNKTGTTTLGQCFERLGLTHTGCSRELLEDFRVRGDLRATFEVADRFDSFEDWPWPLLYRELDQRYPGSKFVLTLRRDPETWLKSLKEMSLRTRPLHHCRKLAYGYHYPHGREQEHLQFYERHRREVLDYFRDRPQDLLVLCWEDGAGWPELCAFLGRPVPAVPLPHANRGESAVAPWRRRAANAILRRFRD
jgi:Sulfotransferase domain